MGGTPPAAKANGEWETSYEPMLTTIAAWQALEQAHAAGIRIDQASRPRRVPAWPVPRAGDRRVPRGALELGAERFVTQAGGVRVLVAEGLEKEADVQRAISVIHKMRFDQDVGGATGGEEFLGAVYATQAPYRCVGRSTRPGTNASPRRLQHGQNADGSWQGHHCITGRVFCTACSIMTLLTPNKPLPLVGTVNAAARRWLVAAAAVLAACWRGRRAAHLALARRQQGGDHAPGLAGPMRCCGAASRPRRRWSWPGCRRPGGNRRRRC